MELKLTLSDNQKIKMRSILDAECPYFVFPSGRRYGKSEFGVRWQCPKIFNNPTTPDSPHGWISPVHRQAKLGFFKYRKFLKANKIPHRPMYTDLFIDIYGTDKLRVQFFSGDKPELMEGFSFKTVVMEEAGILLKKRSVWENSIQPALIDFDAPVLFTGTPKGKGLYHEMYLRGLDKQNKDFISMHATSYDNTIEKGGYLKKEVIDRIVRNLPERVAKQEIYAEFMDDGGMVFRNTKECIRGGAVQPDQAGVLILKPYDKLKKYIGGLDIAKVNDWTVLTIGHPDGEIVYMERFNQLDWSIQKARIIKACKLFHVKLLMDSTGVGSPIYDDLRQSGVSVDGYHFTSQSKKELIDRMIITIEAKKIVMPNWDTLINEFDAYEYDITTAGNIRTNAPSGMHDDIVISVALYNWQVNNGIDTGRAISQIALGHDTESSKMDW